MTGQTDLVFLDRPLGHDPVEARLRHRHVDIATLMLAAPLRMLHFGSGGVARPVHGDLRGTDEDRQTQSIDHSRAGVLMQIALGAVYAWSVFRIPLTQTYGWTVSQVTLAFELAILVLGFASFCRRHLDEALGPRSCFARRVAIRTRYRLAGLSHNLPMLYLTYGVIGGAGLGFGYIVPIATLVRWFPDKRGMITGIAVAGFGAGALSHGADRPSVDSSVGVSDTFVVLGIAYFAVLMLAAAVMKNPPAEGYAPAGLRLRRHS